MKMILIVLRRLWSSGINQEDIVLELYGSIGDEDSYRGVVLVRNRRGWVVPGGFIDVDEPRNEKDGGYMRTSLVRAAIRECREETGLDVDIVESLDNYFTKKMVCPMRSLPGRKVNRK